MISVLEEDAHNTFSNILLRYFMAEGVVCKHGMLLASSCESSADKILMVKYFSSNSLTIF